VKDEDTKYIILHWIWVSLLH